MNIWVLILIILILGGFGVSYWGVLGHVGYGGGGLLLLILVILLVSGRL